MTVEIRVDPEHAVALAKAIDALKAERAQVEWWGGSSVVLTLAIDDLEELAHRYRDARQAVNELDPWSRKVRPLRSVR